MIEHMIVSHPAETIIFLGNGVLCERLSNLDVTAIFFQVAGKFQIFLKCSLANDVSEELYLIWTTCLLCPFSFDRN